MIPRVMAKCKTMKRLDARAIIVYECPNSHLENPRAATGRSPALSRSSAICARVAPGTALRRARRCAPTWSKKPWSSIRRWHGEPAALRDELGDLLLHLAFQ